MLLIDAVVHLLVAGMAASCKGWQMVCPCNSGRGRLSTSARLSGNGAWVCKRGLSSCFLADVPSSARQHPSLFATLGWWGECLVGSFEGDLKVCSEMSAAATCRLWTDGRNVWKASLRGGPMTSWTQPLPTQSLRCRLVELAQLGLG